MDPLLKHMLEVTGQRDGDLLELSMLSAVWQMAQASEVRLYSVIQSTQPEGKVRGQGLLRLRGWVRNNEIRLLEEDPENEPPLNPLSFFPALSNALQHGKALAHGRDESRGHLLWLPIWVEGHASACIEIARAMPFPPRVLDMLEGMVGVYRNFHSLLEYSERDSLTGLLNRKTFERHFSRAKVATRIAQVLEPAAPSLRPERRRAQPPRPMRSNTPQEHPEDGRCEWLAVVDIDHFKKVNDNFGHLYGDEVLILVAQLMTQSFRAHDRVFRFGGEEFVVLLHAASVDDVNVVMERFRIAVENHYFPQVGKITVSVGYTSFHPKEAPVEVLGHADQALYYAKQHGRNRCCQYEALLAAGEFSSAEQTTTPIEFF
ncbi:GGDEF domain-containing protein [Massilia sp. W12]|uniref:GGDEF domain-containing protein n=1 Tax=Massilia sp. W12 TaxID=3126507 RepID=UPI0030CAE271